MEQLISAIERYHPSFRTDIEGCSPEEIDRLQSLVGIHLPDVHVDFLRVMGRRMGGLSLYDGDFRIETLIKRYTEEGAAHDSPLIIAIAHYGPYGRSRETFERPIELEFEEDEGQYVLVAYPPGEREHEFPEAIRILDLVNPTLYEALFAKAYLQYRWARFKHQRTLFFNAHSPKEIEQAAAIVEQFGFERHPESSITVRYFDQRDATAIISPNPGEPVRLSLAAHDAAELFRLANALTKRLPTPTTSA
ncbi:hypothetical protein [Archangium sp.]|uniref:hypothetical protein n=1 Tax=Archangium sp. TaxID=1872627 RepID=UPI002D31DF83|nr:hypothetical protein [Archangium sp.]HYO55820.1 hypothetical protein [Archangium sp.]